MKNKFQDLRKRFPQIVFMEEKGEFYLDSAATALKIDVGIEVLRQFYETNVSNVHRGEHNLSLKATEKYEKAREKIAHFLNAEFNEIVFTRNTTESLNLLAHSLGSFLQEGDEILVTQMEHHSNFLPWQVLAQKKGLKLKVAPVTSSALLDLNLFEQLLNPKTKIVSLTHVSNVTGVLNPLDEISSLIRKKTSAYFILDAAQSVSCQNLNVKKINCDFLVFSSHKIFAPSGIGVLYGKKKLLEKLPPYQVGGGMITDVSETKSEWAKIPYKFEAGTPFIEGVIALGEVLSFLRKELDFKELLKWEQNLVFQAENLLSQIPGLRFIGCKKNRTNILSFVIEGVHSSDLAFILAKEKLALRAGHHCCIPLMKALCLNSGTLRASFSLYNREEEIYKLKRSLDTALSILL
ncbi:MAG: cysteine desulfurase [Bdellovibrionales bacterium]|nr:cysteine desulfurase [Bdellovibrionales bacterium]